MFALSTCMCVCIIVIEYLHMTPLKTNVNAKFGVVLLIILPCREIRQEQVKVIFTADQRPCNVAIIAYSTNVS